MGRLRVSPGLISPYPACMCLRADLMPKYNGWRRFPGSLPWTAGRGPPPCASASRAAEDNTHPWIQLGPVAQNPARPLELLAHRAAGRGEPGTTSCVPRGLARWALADSRWQDQVQRLLSQLRTSDPALEQALLTRIKTYKENYSCTFLSPLICCLEM